MDERIIIKDRKLRIDIYISLLFLILILAKKWRNVLINLQFLFIESDALIFSGIKYDFFIEISKW